MNDVLLKKASFKAEDICDLSSKQLIEILRYHNIQDVEGSKENLIKRILNIIPEDEDEDEDEDDDDENMNEEKDAGEKEEEDEEDDEKDDKVIVTPAKDSKRKREPETYDMKVLLKKKKYTKEDIKNLKADDLEMILRQHNLSPTGKKLELQERVLHNIPNSSNKEVVSSLSEEFLNKDKYTMHEIKDLKANDLALILLYHDEAYSGKKNELIERVKKLGNDDDEDIQSVITEDADIENEQMPSSKKQENDSLKFLEMEKYDLETLSSFTIKQLRSVLTFRGLKSSGTKVELIERCLTFIPMPKFNPPNKNISYEDDLADCMTFSITRSVRCGVDCKRCTEEIDQGRLRVSFTKGKKVLPYHFECFCKYPPACVVGKPFKSITWEEGDDNHVEECETLYDEYAAK